MSESIIYACDDRNCYLKVQRFKKARLVYCIAVSAGYTGLRVRVHTYPICVIMSIIIRPIVIN